MRMGLQSGIVVLDVLRMCTCSCREHAQSPACIQSAAWQPGRCTCAGWPRHQANAQQLSHSTGGPGKARGSKPLKRSRARALVWLTQKPVVGSAHRLLAPVAPVAMVL